MFDEIPSQASLIGAVTGGYRVLSRIGSGTMGHVYDAEDVKNGKHVALKVLRKSHQKDLAARFLREGKTLALLSHPNIVQLVDMGQLDDGTLFLATELVAGSSLREVMDREPLEQRRALALVRQLLDALQAAHDLGVVHRDIKPENVMIADGDYVKVLDFGVAKLLADTVAGLGEANLTSVGFSIFGSALYIAPESVTGQPVDARIDIYSTGAMLFEMLAGRPPFDDEDPAVLLRKQAFEPPPTLAQAAPSQTFAPAIEALVARALAKQPDDRYRSAADMIEAVDAAMRAFDRPRPVTAPSAADPVPARPSVPDARRAETDIVRKPRSRRLVLAGVAAGVLALAGIAIATRGGNTGPAATHAAWGVPAARGPEATSPDQAVTYLSKGHSELALGHYQQALAAYERALRAAPQLGTDKTLRANLLKVLEGKDSLATVLALDVLSMLSPPEHAAIAAYASNGKLVDARHRAMMIAERDGIVDKVDRVQSWMLDLQQTASCDERKALIEQLVAAADRRALVAFRRIRTVKCVEREVNEAIARLDAN